MGRLGKILTFCLGVVFAGPQAHAEIIHLVAHLTHANEPGAGPLTTSTGGPRPLSYGTAVFLLDTSAPQFMTMTATFFNIDVTGSQTADTFDNLTAAHIHAANVNPPTPLPLTFPVRWGFFGLPDNNIPLLDYVLTPFATGVGGVITSVWDAPEGNGGTNLSAQLFNILNELAYLNFHTVQFGGGEIRGTLFVVPEPASLALLGLGLFGLAALRRRS